MDGMRIIEGLLCVIFGLLSWFGNRTLKHYDARLSKSESRDDDIVDTLNEIKLKIERIETILETRKLHSRSSQ